jgi:hypothetical protein
MTDVTRLLENPVEATTIVKKFVLLLAKRVPYFSSVFSKSFHISTCLSSIFFFHSTRLASNKTNFFTMVVASTGFSKSLGKDRENMEETPS